MKQLICAILAICMLSVIFVGCTPVLDKYTTDYAMSAQAYCSFLNKQIAAVTNQLSSQMILAARIDEKNAASVLEGIETSISIISDAQKQVEITYPPAQYATNRENVLRLMDIAKADMGHFAEELGKPTLDTSRIKEIAQDMQNHIVMLTAEFNIYYE